MRPEQDSFSLMELLLALALGTVIVAMSVPAWRHNQLAAGVNNHICSCILAAYSRKCGIYNMDTILQILHY